MVLEEDHVNMIFVIFHSLALTKVAAPHAPAVVEEQSILAKPFY